MTLTIYDEDVYLPLGPVGTHVEVHIARAEIDYCDISEAPMIRSLTFQPFESTGEPVTIDYTQMQTPALVWPIFDAVEKMLLARHQAEIDRMWPPQTYETMSIEEFV